MEISMLEKVKMELSEARIKYDETILQDENWLTSINNCIDFFNKSENNKDEIDNSNDDTFAYSWGDKSGRVSFSTDVNKKDVINWIMSLAFAMVGHPWIGVIKVTLSTLIKKICLLSHEERCVFTIIVYLTNNDRKKEINKRDVADFYQWNDSFNGCPFFECFDCDNRNREDKELCGYREDTFDLESILVNLSEYKVIRYDKKTKAIYIL